MYLLEPYTLKQITIKNRVVMPAMCQYSATPKGFATDWHYIHYPSRAVGGVGLIILEATAVEARGRLSNHDLGIYCDEHVDGLQRIVKLCRDQGSKVGIQLAHGGRKSYGNETVAPSALRYSLEYPIPSELSKAEIKNIIKGFGQGATRSDQAGFDLLQIHGAHGYLIHEFLSPLSNTRDDEYGGSLENRMRFLLEVLTAVKAHWPQEKLLSVRLSAVDHLPGGLTIQDTITICRILKDAGVDLIDISSGGVLPAEIRTAPGYQIEYAHRVKAEADIPTIAVGLISSGELAEAVVANGQADFLALGRELLRNPYWVLQLAESEPAVEWPLQYRRARRQK